MTQREKDIQTILAYCDKRDWLCIEIKTAEEKVAELEQELAAAKLRVDRVKNSLARLEDKIRPTLPVVKGIK